LFVGLDNGDNVRSIAQSLSEEQNVEMIIINRTKEGVVYTVQLLMKPLYNHKKEIEYVVAMQFPLQDDINSKGMRKEMICNRRYIDSFPGMIPPDD
jgi:hypothetical protein